MEKLSIYNGIILKLKNLLLGKNNKKIIIMEVFISKKLTGVEVVEEELLFNSGRQNFIRLKERFKHDNTWSEQIKSDWYDYLIIINDVINLRKSNKEYILSQINEKLVQINEINKRFKYLLGKDFLSKII
ncbi:MAG: hypothetical protein V4486_01440 [Patescibacteria group bacterium]